MNTIEIAKSLGDQVLKETPPQKIPVTINHDRFVDDDGNTMAKLSVATPGEALRSSLIILFKHVADVHLTVVDIIAEKYKLNQDDILNAIKGHPKWLAIFNDPVVHDLTEDLRVDIPFEKAKKAAASGTKKPRMAGKKRSADTAMEDVTEKMAAATISAAAGAFPPLPLPVTAVAPPTVPSIPTFPVSTEATAAAPVAKKTTKKFKKPIKVTTDKTN